MDKWEQGQIVNLIRFIEEHSDCGLRRRPGIDETEEESMARRFNAMVKNGKLRPAIRTLTKRVASSYAPPTLAQKRSCRNSPCSAKSTH